MIIKLIAWILKTYDKNNENYNGIIIVESIYVGGAPVLVVKDSIKEGSFMFSQVSNL